MPRVSVRKAGEGSTQATYEPNWLETKGTLRFRDGRVFIWKRARLWRNQCRFENLDGETLVVSTTNVERGKGGNVQNTEGLVIIDQHARTLDELSLLVVLDWYLTVCRLNNPAFAVCSS